MNNRYVKTDTQNMKFREESLELKHNQIQNRAGNISRPNPMK